MAEEPKASAAESATPSADSTASVQGEKQTQEAQQVQSQDTGSATKGEPQKDNSIAGLDVSNLPPEAQDQVKAWAEKREKDQLRYITQKSQEVKDIQKKAETYDKFVKSPVYDEFYRWYQNRGTVQQQSPQAATDAATARFKSAGFSDEESAAMADAVRQEIHQAVNQEKQYFSNQLQNLTYQQQVIKAQQDLENLAKLHPEVNDMLDSGLLKMVAQQPGNSGKTVEELYTEAKKVRDHYLQSARKDINQTIQEKKKAVTATPSASGDSDVVYVQPGATREQTQKIINDTAYKYALEGKKVRVRAKKS